MPRRCRLPIGAADLSIVLKSQILEGRLDCAIEAILEGKIVSLRHDLGSALASKDAGRFAAGFEHATSTA